MAGCAGTGIVGSPFQGSWEGDAVAVLTPDHTAWHMTLVVDGTNATFTYQDQTKTATVASDGTVTGNVTGKLSAGANVLGVQVKWNSLTLEGQLSRTPR